MTETNAAAPPAVTRATAELTPSEPWGTSTPSTFDHGEPEVSAEADGVGSHVTRFRPTQYRPPWWLRNAHAQTLAGIFLRPRGWCPLERHRLETPDGDFLDLDLTPEPAPGAPLALVLHGLEGFIRRPYASGVLSRLFDRGVQGVGMNFRGCGGEPNRTPRFYHAGDTGDLAFVTEYLARRFPGRPIGAIGFSLGGNVILKYLGERGPHSPISAAATICVPFDLAKSCDQLGGGFMGGFYTSYFLRSLRNKVRAKQAMLKGIIDTERALHARTLREFDEALTAPLHGFADAADYYARSDARAFLGRIRVPVLVIQGRDDPFLGPGALPEAEMQANPHLVAAFAPGGGHVGFVAGKVPWRASAWADPEAVRFLVHHLRPVA